MCMCSDGPSRGMGVVISSLCISGISAHFSATHAHTYTVLACIHTPHTCMQASTHSLETSAFLLINNLLLRLFQDYISMSVSYFSNLPSVWECLSWVLCCYTQGQSTLFLLSQ